MPTVAGTAYTLPGYLWDRGGAVYHVQHPEFGVKADGVTDDTAALQAVLTLAASTGVAVLLPPGVIRITAELTIPATAAKGFEIRGAGHSYGLEGTTLKAGASMRSVLSLGMGYMRISGVKLDAARLATYGMYLQGAPFSRFTGVYAVRALRDGFYLTATKDGGGATNNDQIYWTDCWATECGVAYRTAGIAAEYAGVNNSAVAGTAATTAGSQTVTLTGAPDLTTLGLRSGDLLRVGATSPEWLHVEAWTANTVTVGVRGTPTLTRSGQDYALTRGDGYHEERHNDNNNAVILGGLWRGNAGSGLAIAGLYGPTITAPQVDANTGYGITVGRLDNQGQVHRTAIIKPYFEGNLAGSLLLAFCDGVDVSMPLWGDTTRYRVGASFQNAGTIRSFDTVGGIALVEELIGGGASNVPALRTQDAANTGRRSSAAVGATVSSASTTIPILAVHQQLTVTTPLTMTATPTLATGVDGEEVLLVNVSVNALTLQNETALAGSGLRLVASSITLGYRQSVRLTYLGAFGYWLQTGPVVAVV